jgi:hypothetical protein
MEAVKAASAALCVSIRANTGSSAETGAMLFARSEVLRAPTNHSANFATESPVKRLAMGTQEVDGSLTTFIGIRSVLGVLA